MEHKNKKCSFKEHKDIDAISYCQDCEIFICNKCANYHQGLFENHQITNINGEKDIFFDICKEKNHPMKLEFFCKTHNKLCCAACISKLETKGYGQHKDCDICIIEDIKEEKKNKLKDNIKYLEDLYNNLNEAIKELKILFDKIEERKEDLKSKIQNIFTKIRTALNEREDELLLEVDNKYNDLYGNENIIKESERLPNKVKLSLEKGKSIDSDLDNNKLSSFINNCIMIEESIKNINMINDSIQKCKSNNNVNIEFNIQNENLDTFFKSIKLLCQINILSKFDSIILNNKDDIEHFNNLLSNQIKINDMKLLYRSSRDGLELNNLKEKINNKSNLIFLFLAGDNRIFGTYIKAEIKVEHNFYTNDKDAFVFSLNNDKIYKILIPEYAIRFFNKYPILIGNNANSNGFRLLGGKIYDNILLNKPKIYDFQKECELTDGSNEFKDLEIFEINNS